MLWQFHRARPLAVCLCWSTIVAALFTARAALGQSAPIAGAGIPAAAPLDDEAAADDVDDALEHDDAAAGDRPAPASEVAEHESAVPLEDDAEAQGDDDRHAAIAVDGVRAGLTAREELPAAWGKPKQAERIAGGARETYHLARLGEARLTIAEGVVASIAIQVDPPLSVSAVGSRLAIEAIEPVDVYDESGQLLGAAYPPAGVLLGYAAGSSPPRVVQVLVEPLDAQMFLARAEQRLATRYADCLSDLEQAIQLAPQCVQAYELHAELALRSGDLDGAMRSAEKAASLAPEVASHGLLVARALAASGDYATAIARLRNLAENRETPALVAARACCLWGTCLATGVPRNTAMAIKHHQRAIQLAEPLMQHENQVLRRAAKELLFEAHLAVAYDIGWGRWQQKPASTQRWIDRAAAFANDLAANERGGEDLFLRLHVGALAALAGIPDPPPADKSIRGLRVLGKRLYDESSDPVYRACLSWQVAGAMSDAVEIEAARGNAPSALALGKTAWSLFGQTGAAAQRLPTFHYEPGQLCYRVGVVFAVSVGDHGQAVAWFDRATPLLEKPVPDALVDSGVQGEAFVGMAVSYWELENRREALRLTNQGLALMEQAVRNGTLEKTALAVPYGNLARMHEALGDPGTAKKFAELAARHQKPGTR